MRNQRRVQELEEHCREEIIANGKARFVRREVAFSTAFFSLLAAFFYFDNGRSESSLVAGLTVLPIGILGGYLHAIWKWQDITKHLT